jgi:hypothetical protein
LLLTKGQHGRKYASPKPKRDEDDIISLSSVFVPFPAGNSCIATDQLSGGGGLAKIVDTIFNAQIFSKK